MKIEGLPIGSHERIRNQICRDCARRMNFSVERKIQNAQGLIVYSGHCPDCGNLLRTKITPGTGKERFPLSQDQRLFKEEKKRPVISSWYKVKKKGQPPDARFARGVCRHCHHLVEFKIEVDENSYAVSGRCPKCDGKVVTLRRAIIKPPQKPLGYSGKKEVIVCIAEGIFEAAQLYDPTALTSGLIARICNEMQKAIPGVTPHLVARTCSTALRLQIRKTYNKNTQQQGRFLVWDPEMIGRAYQIYLHAGGNISNNICQKLNLPIDCVERVVSSTKISV